MHRRIILWDGESGHEKLSFESSHINNIFKQSSCLTWVIESADGQARRALVQNFF
ncbi:hypothetical protein PVL29_026343 [Vitis rotundifolia]|uniref:Uncharacterized protein n=1 Tax=Vitis rotundifolia TaxID=103349 RepID=A0AA38YM63_VITRO|nr:hypothetical protein PVL29_026343 [Vitis rotundifolia]